MCCDVAESSLRIPNSLSSISAAFSPTINLTRKTFISEFIFVRFYERAYFRQDEMEMVKKASQSSDRFEGGTGEVVASSDGFSRSIRKVVRSSAEFGQL
jgi:hypothetical protein